MKHLFTTIFCALLITVCGWTTLQAQVCQVDSQYQSAGIYPSDTLPDMEVGTAYSEVVQFVFPSDTVVFGFTLNFDSFIVANVSGIPVGIDWECNENHPTCHYIASPPQLTRGCVKIFGTPTAQSPAYPAYDSIIVTGEAWVTIPFSGPTSFSQDIPVYYRTSDPLSANDPFAKFNLEMAPNPIVDAGMARFDLATAATVRLTVVDLYGRELAVVAEDVMGAGSHEVEFSSRQLPVGIYLLRATVDDGQFVATQRFYKSH